LRPTLEALLTIAGLLCLPIIALAQIPNKPAHDVLITLLETNDLHGTVYKPGEPKGLTKIATLVRGIRKQMPNVLLLDSGDMIQGAPDEKRFEGESILTAMNTMGYTAAAAGNHEFDYGLDGTAKAVRLADFPILSANVEDAATGQVWSPLKPYIIRDVDGVRVAIFGLTTLETLIYEWPPALKAVHFANPIDTARRLVPKLRNDEHADVVIALTHLGTDVDADLAEQVSGIDFILGGHSHTTLSRQIWVGNTLIAQTGSHADWLGRIDFVVHVAGGAKIASVNGKDGRWWGHDGVPAPTNQAFPASPLLILEGAVDDPALLAAYRPYLDKMAPDMRETLTSAAEALPGSDLGQKETAVGDLIADAVKARGGADIAVVNPDDLSKDGLPAGPVHVSDLYHLINQYTCQALVRARVHGDKLADCIAAAREHGAAPLCFSGVRVESDGPGSARRITVDGSPIDVDRDYTVVGPASVIAAQFLGLPGVAIVSDDPHAATVRDAVIDYLRGRSPLTNTIDHRWQP
jgi:2',3'-cyclic-nucleotide 2'-phosphodiesterase (5'-nucleotidase family)